MEGIVPLFLAAHDIEEWRFPDSSGDVCLKLCRNHLKGVISKTSGDPAMRMGSTCLLSTRLFASVTVWTIKINMSEVSQLFMTP